MALPTASLPELTIDSLLTVVRLVAGLPADHPDTDALRSVLETLDPLEPPVAFGDAELSHYREHGWVVVRGFFGEWTAPVRDAVMAAFSQQDTTRIRPFEPLAGHSLRDDWSPSTDPVVQAATRFGPAPLAARKALGSGGTLTSRGTVLFLKHPPLTYGSPWHTDTQDLPARTDPGVNVWVPLHDTDAESGAVQLIAGSHRLSHEETLEVCNPDEIRRIERGESPTLAHPIPGLRSGDHEFIAPSFEAGDALVFDSSMIHGAGGNRSDHPVAAISTLWFAPE